MNEIINSIIKRYAIARMNEGDTSFDFRELKIFLGMLDCTTLGDILADLIDYKESKGE